MGKHNSKEAQPKVLQSLRSDTEFTGDEIMEIFNEFQKDCPSGRLSLEDFKKLHGAHFSEGEAAKYAEHVFRSFDANGDQTVDFREFLCAMSVMTRGTLEAKLRLMFTIYNLDGNEYISRDEMLEIVQTIFKMIDKESEEVTTPEEYTDNVFNNMDKNADNKISLEEFIEGAKSDPSLIKLMAIPEALKET
ncbi:unnamed protein product [Meganyctiphanes norvegica]|uniref:EF-hand domain-containing protein n=1 Tax=Meganyctiphanes norvegica TaxID=48144 RepID=A0AAV2Q456_MEGNR